MFFPTPRSFLLLDGLISLLFGLVFDHSIKPKPKPHKRPGVRRTPGPRRYHTAKEIDEIIKKITSP